MRKFSALPQFWGGVADYGSHNTGQDRDSVGVYAFARAYVWCVCMCVRAYMRMFAGTAGQYLWLPPCKVVTAVNSFCC